ncbi:MAG: arginine deiminase family protein [Candidatus Ancaeobacter aquaticus]|nr:arginine deiminase family protein [Candidatus Ancaeobacter aquaticus]
MNNCRKLKSVVFLLSLIAVLMCSSSIVFSSDIKPEVKAEWDRVETIVMQPPSIADFWISIFPKGNGYDTPFNYLAAKQEHLHYANILRAAGIKIYMVEDVLLEGTVDKDGNAIQGKKLNDLQNFAKKYLKIKCNELDDSVKKELEIEKDKAIKSLPPHVLIDLILQNPVITAEKDPNSISDFDAKYSLHPLLDLFYLRDQIITTPKGIVLGKFARAEVRHDESEVVKFALNKLGIKPVYAVTGKGTLEGGDFFMADGIAFIGEGVRTNSEGIKQLMDNDVIGVRKVVVVKDHLLSPAQMHLDTYFNLPAPKVAVLSLERVKKVDGGVDDSKASTVDVYELKNGSYIQTVKDRDFRDYLIHDLKYKIIPVSVKDQRALATNFLTIAPYTIVGPEGASQEFKDALKKEGVEATWVDMTNIKRGFGAARCVTQPIQRRQD